MQAEEAIAALVELLPPPERPTRPDRIDWARFERENGFAAPTDYRLLIERYGVGTFGTSETAQLGGWLYLHDPSHPEQSLLLQTEWIRRNARGLQRQFPEQFPGWPMWPEPEGLLPWGGSIDGDELGWWTRGAPDEWGTRFFGRDDTFLEFQFGIAEFLVRMYRGELDSRFEAAFGPPRPENAPQFFQRAADAPAPVLESREYVTVVFAGLSRTIDPTAAPSSAAIFKTSDPAESKAAADDYWRRFVDFTRPADEIFESWKSGAERMGLRVDGWGAHSKGGGDPLHHELQISFAPDGEETAKGAVAELPQLLGVAISEVRNVEHDLIWEDLCGPRLRLVR